MNEIKYHAFLTIFSHSPFTLSSCSIASPSTLSRFLSNTSFNPMPLIQSMCSNLLSLLPQNHTAFLIADTTLLRKTGSKFEGIKKLYDPSIKRTTYAHRALVVVLSVGNVCIPLHVELITRAKPIEALISSLEKLLPSLKKLFPKLVFLCDGGLTSNKLLNFLLAKEVDFVCSVSQSRVDEESGQKLRDLWFPRPERVKFKGVKRDLYAYRLGEGSDKERVVVSNKCLSVKKFGSYYRVRWEVETEIRSMKALGLEDYMVRSIRAIRLWILGVWHASLIRLMSKLKGLSFRYELLSLVMPSVYLHLLEIVELVQVGSAYALRFDRRSLMLCKSLGYSLLKEISVYGGAKRRCKELA